MASTSRAWCWRWSAPTSPSAWSPAELLRRVNEKVRDPITGNREQARWLRDTLAHGVLAHLGREPIGLTDQQFQEASRRAEQARTRIEAAGYDVRGDLADLAATRPDARLPGEASDAELLDTALETIVRLLVLVRSNGPASGTRARSETLEEGSRLASFGKGVVRRVTAQHVDRRHDALRARIAELELEVAAARSLHLRVAELTDVVTELLLPPGPGGEGCDGPGAHEVPQGRAVTTGPLRTVAPVELARRVAVGIGLAEVRDLEQRLALVAEQVEENAVLGRGLEAQVTRLEQALVPVLARRARRTRDSG